MLTTPAWLPKKASGSGNHADSSPQIQSMAHSTLLASPFLHEFIKTFEFKPYRGSVMPFEWNSSWSQHSLKSLEHSLKSSELKTKLKFPFTTILPVHGIQFLSSSAQDGEDAGKGLKLEQDWLAFSSFRPGYIPKSPKTLGCLSPAKIIWYSFPFKRNVSTYESSTQFRFSTSWPKNSKNNHGSVLFIHTWAKSSGCITRSRVEVKSRSLHHTIESKY